MSSNPVIDELIKLYEEYKPNSIHSINQFGHPTHLRRKKIAVQSTATILGALINTSDPADVTAKSAIAQRFLELDQSFQEFNPTTETCKTLTPSIAVTTKGSVSLLGAKLAPDFDLADATEWIVKFKEATDRWSGPSSTGSFVIPWQSTAKGDYLGIVENVQANVKKGEDPLEVLVHFLVPNVAADVIECPSSSVIPCLNPPDCDDDDECEEDDLAPCSLSNFKPIFH